MLQLHYFPGSLAPHVLVEELGVAFELKLVDRVREIGPLKALGLTRYKSATQRTRPES